MSEASQDVPGDDRIDTSNENGQVREMIEWFLARYEDPVDHCPYDGREGGYQFIYGGPYYTRENLEEHFGDRVSGPDLDRAIGLLDGVCGEWSGKPDEANEDAEDDDDSEPVPVNVITVIVSDSVVASDILASVVGLTSPELRALVAEKNLRHGKWHGHIYVLVDDVLRALVQQ